MASHTGKVPRLREQTPPSINPTLRLNMLSTASLQGNQSGSVKQAGPLVRSSVNEINGKMDKQTDRLFRRLPIFKDIGLTRDVGFGIRVSISGGLRLLMLREIPEVVS